MRLQPMKYGDFIWPHNPETLIITCKRNIKELSVPFAGGVMQDYGAEKRVIEGEGEFYGNNCIQQFYTLSGQLEKTGKALLTLPNLAPFYARFVSLKMVGTPEPDLVKYHFVFWEDGASGTEIQAESGQVYLCREGEDLWGIAAQYSTTAEQLLKLNPGIQWPNYLSEGEQVILP